MIANLLTENNRISVFENGTPTIICQHLQYKDVLYLRPFGRNFNVKLYPWFDTPRLDVEMGIENSTTRKVDPTFIFDFNTYQMAYLSCTVLAQSPLGPNRQTDGLLVHGAVAQWTEFCLVNRTLLAVQLPPMPLCSSLGQVACLSLSHASDSFT